MDKKINNFLRAYGAEESTDKKRIIEKLITHIGNEDEISEQEFINLVKSLSTKLKSEDDDLAKIRKIIKEID